jgi:hypothetical protein
MAKDRVKSDVPVPASPSSAPTKKKTPKKTKKTQEKQLSVPHEAKAENSSTQTATIMELSHPILWILAFIVFLLVIPFVWTLAARVSALEQEVTFYKDTSRNLETKVVFLRMFVEQLTENVTGKKGSLQQHADLWKGNPELLGGALLEWQNRLDKIHEDILNSKKFLDSVKSFEEIMDFREPKEQPNVDQSFFGWKLALILTVIAGGATTIWIFPDQRTKLLKLIKLN